MKSLTITSPRLRIPNPWIRDIISEILSTYVFVLFGIGVVAQEVISGVGPSTGMVVNFAVSLALTMAIYVSGNASGGYVNPGIALSMCLTGYVEWKKYPVFVLCYFTGAFLASATVYAIYYEDINGIDGGHRMVTGINGTAAIFSTFPPNYLKISKGTLFLEVAVGHGLLVLCTLAILDSRNMAPSNGLAPIPIGLSVFPICTAFSRNAGCPINSTKDFAPRVMLLAAGYGSEVFSYGNYWFWVSPVATTVGSILATLLYQLVIATQWPPMVDISEGKFDSRSTIEMTEHYVGQKDNDVGNSH